MLKEHADPTYTQMYTASPGWFLCFKKCHNLHTVKVSDGAVAAGVECAEACRKSCIG